MAPSASYQGNDRISLERISFLLVDASQVSLDIMGQVLSGFGVRTVMKAHTVDQAKSLITRQGADFILLEAHLSGASGFDLLRWVRREAGEPTRFCPAVVVTADTSDSIVRRARDTGAHFLVAKPITPKVLLDRIFWIARENRPFIGSESYAGPDRRFRQLGPPPGVAERRVEEPTDYAPDPDGGGEDRIVL